MCEKWKDIDGYEGCYQVSDLGRIKSVGRIVVNNKGRSVPIKERILAPFKGTTCNYLSIQLCKNNKTQKFLIHRLVAIAFLGLDPTTDLEVNHKNGEKFDNRVSNLEIVTHQENIGHSVATNLKNDYGELSANAKLTNKDAEEIRRQHKRGVMQIDLAEAYGVCKQTICSIVHYKTYFR